MDSPIKPDVKFMRFGMHILKPRSRNSKTKRNNGIKIHLRGKVYFGSENDM